MSRVFAYCRVSTDDQTTVNQRREIEAAGFAIDKRRIVEECISGSMAASERPGFAKLLDRLEDGDALMIKLGDAPPVKFAGGAKWASAASGKDAACVVWEGAAAEGTTLWFERLP